VQGQSNYSGWRLCALSLTCEQSPDATAQKKSAAVRSGDSASTGTATIRIHATLLISGLAA